MYYQEKRAVVTVVSGLLLLAAYCIFAFVKFQEGGLERLNDLNFWAVSMLVFMGIGIGAMIVIQIVFHIINAVINKVKGEAQDASDAEDEMDKLIALKATKGLSITGGVGFIIALITLVLNQPPALMLNIIFVSFQIGSLIEGFLQLHYYKRGIRHG